MSNISIWIISITVCTLLSVMIDIILPAGKMSKMTKALMGIFTMIVIISPIKNIDLSKLNLSNISQFNIDNKFVQDRQDDMLLALEGEIESNLNMNGYLNVYIKVNGNFENGELEIENVLVDLENLIINDNSLNINTYTNIMAVIKKTLDIDEKKVIYYE